MEQKADVWLDNNRGITTEILCEQPVIRHTFNHFHLDITPVKLKLRSSASTVEDKLEACWYKPDGGLKLGMAAPVKKIVDGLFSTAAAGETP